MQSQTIVCQTGRLALRHFTMEDLQPLAAMHCNPEVSRFIGGVKTLEQTRQRLLGWMEEYKRYGFAKWAVILRSTGEFIGRCGLSLEQFDDTSEWELGWTLARAYWVKATQRRPPRPPCNIAFGFSATAGSSL